MTAIINASAVSFANLLAFTGKGAKGRAASLASIPTLARDDVMARDELVATVKAVLGAEPDADHIKVVRTLIVTGRIAARLPAAKDQDDGAHIAHCYELVTSYAAPVKEGTKARALRAGQKGRRSAVEHKAIRAAEEALSQIMADVGLGAAKPQAERKKATRAAHRNTPKATQATVADTAPSHDALIVKPSQMTAQDAHEHIERVSRDLLAFCSKYAKVVSTDYGTAVHTLKSEITKAANARHVRETLANAIKD